jgi:hypothetical protein
MLAHLSGGGESLGLMRKLRAEYPGAIYHVMNLGDRRGSHRLR